MGPIKYRKGYKYQISADACGQTPIKPEKAIETEFINMTVDGFLFIRAGYAWDGASVPITHWLSNKIGGKKTKTPSLVHDAFCQLIRQGYLPDKTRKEADLYFYDLLRERKMWKFRAKLWLRGVRIGAKANRQKPKEIYQAP